MAERLLGIETEYALTVRGRDGGPMDRARAARGLFRIARSRHPHLKRLLKGRLWLHPNLSRFRERGHRTDGRYESARDWDRYGTYIYRKNGFSIHGAEAIEVLHLMRAMQLLGQDP